VAITPGTVMDDQISVVKVPFDDIELLFEASNDMVKWRAQSVYTKEPDTVAWIRQFKAGEVLVDIGANVGMYTIMAAKGRGVQVFAFEPESQNYALLNRNIVYNRLADLCIAYPLALSNVSRVDKLYLSSFSLGGSCHTFGASLDFHLQERKQSFVQGCMSVPLDILVGDGVIPQPDHIKIDVDGLEHLVMEGASNVLRHPKLKSVLVELNTHLREHREIVSRMQDLGYEFQPEQVDLAIRREGSFEGVGNYIFFRPESGICFDDLVERLNGTAIDYAAVQAHVNQRIASMNIEQEPYPHFFVTDLFPEAYYRRMMAMKPSNEELICLDDTGRAKGYPERFVMHLGDHLGNLRNPRKRRFWERHREWFCSQELMVTMVRRFYDVLVARGQRSLNIETEAMFMRDLRGYSIGPHTDTSKRLLTMMVYLPDDADHAHLGTTVYAPRDATLRSDGVAHFKASHFDPVGTAQYLPNSAFGFLRSDNSFHGVAPMQDDYQRDTMAYIVRHKKVA
jgi:FkbM family methyltransferase